MKKIHFLGAAMMAAVMSWGLISCGSDDEIDTPITPPTIKEVDKDIEAMKPIALDPAKDSEHFKTITFKGDAPLTKLHILDDGKVLAVMTETPALSPTRANSNVFAEGTYTVNPDGSVTASVAGYTIKVGMTDNMTTINDVLYSTEMTTGTTSNASATLCRTWYPEKYDVVAYVKNTVIGHYEETSLMALQSTLSKELGTDVKLLEGDVNKITFMTNSTIITNYKNKNYEVANWAWTSEAAGILTASFSANDQDMMNIPTFVRFEKGTPNICYLVSAFKTVTTGMNDEEFTVDLKVVITMKDAE